MSTPIIEASAITKTFPGRRGGQPFHALRNVSSKLFEGEILGLVGESGSGKTTLSRIMIGIETATTGEVSFQGRPVQSRADWKALRRDVQYVFQDPFTALCPTMRIGAALAEPLAIHRLCPASERPERVARMLEMIGLGPEMARRLPAQLSGGQRQRVSLARALMLEPRVLICDEIVSGLDVSVQAQVLALLVELQRKLGLSLIFISHDLRVIRYLCDRVQVMLLGQIVEEGPAAQVFDAPENDYTRALLAAIPDRDRLPVSESA
ncbi:ABC transporter ATP-binding protein [Frigidibacter sp. ROC022]|uniref:ABC transporter ATP-binding protein n=1 Tax=Frigidibacter sp. ROC022 TaxID=2971796 RepID=UPI00215AAD5E|nr:ATP-binding cassette domain-containing protein [Frigidibacter sp. ROC022]MCR8726379.1 ATP-binding cassette domain-containing protein [Frigidibacter sp. ROC022]